MRASAGRWWRSVGAACACCAFLADGLVFGFAKERRSQLFLSCGVLENRACLAWPLVSQATPSTR
eukprot:2354126-Lingulodinium_polyedra.AAC.1